MNFVKILQIANPLQQQLMRNYAFKSKLKIKWVRPEKIPSIRPEKSGDMSKLPPVNPNEFLLGYRDSKELQTADPSVQSLFQLGNNKNVNTTLHYCDQMVREVQRHPLDFGSMEARLAKMTAKIRRLQEHMEQFPRDVRMKVKLKELIDKRKKFLKYLRRWDYRRFEWILEKLDLEYKPPPTEFHWITRKESLKKLTDKYCEETKEKHLLEYHKILEKEIPLLEEEITKMEAFRNEQIAANVTVTMTEEKINKAKDDLRNLREKEAFLKEQERSKDEIKFPFV